MKDIKPIIAANLVTLRKEKGLTQAELAEKLGYSDKAISRWERGDTLPDISMLYEICNYYNITLDMLVSDEPIIREEEKVYTKNSLAYKIWATMLSVTFVWLAATITFIYSNVKGEGYNFWMAFVWAVPLTCIVLKIAGRNIFNTVLKIITDSVLIWSILASFYLQLLPYNIWMIFLLGFPVQAIIFLWIRMKKYR
jgi:transcriptional regulator with XRE-family HTH domain